LSRTTVKGPVKNLTQIHKAEHVHIHDRPVQSRIPAEVVSAHNLIASTVGKERRQGIGALARMDSPEATEALSQALRSGYQDVRLLAAMQLAKRRDSRSITELVKAVGRQEIGAFDPSKDDIFAALEPFGAEVVNHFGSMLDSSDGRVRAMATLALSRMNDPVAIQFLTKALKDADTTVRGHAIDALGRTKSADAAAVQGLITLLSDSSEITHSPEHHQVLPRMSDWAFHALLDIDSSEAKRAVGAYRRQNAERLKALEREVKDRRETGLSKLDVILGGARHLLDSDPDYKRTISLLEKEREGTLAESDAIPEGDELRNLPAFLEETWEELQTSFSEKNMRLDAVYERLGACVLLCDQSWLLWHDEKPRKNKKYWRSFRKFARAMKQERERLSSAAL
jgi:hypothetical protein